MIENNIFSCYIIGNDNITLQCAEIIIANGHKLLGIISAADKIKTWCIANTVHHFDNITQFKISNHLDFDFLFSIINEEILSQEILTLPRYYCINYHDSPLPKYAGLYATTHAILNNEKEHAISWHMMESTIDAGDILKQPVFKIDKTDTALSLNLKCYEHAIQSFRNLVTELATNNTQPTKQNLEIRSYFGLKDKPPNLGFILWNQSSEAIDRLIRSLTFGNYPNQLGTAKIIFDKAVFILTGYEVSNKPSTYPPGTITYISEEIIQITTQTFDILISDVSDLQGNKYSIKNLSTKMELKLYQKLPEIEIGFLKTLIKHPAMNPKIERFWVRELLNCTNSAVLFLSKMENKTPYKNTSKITKIPNEYLNKMQQISQEYSIVDILLTMSLVYLFRLNNYQNYSVLYSTPTLKKDLEGLTEFLSERLPLTTSFHSNLSFLEALKIVANNKAVHSQNHTFTNDLFIRYPELHLLPDLLDININVTDKNEIYQDKKLNFHISSDGTWFNFTHSFNLKTYGRSNAYLKNLNQNFLCLLKDIVLAPHKAIFEFSIVDKSEQDKLFLTWNATAHKYNHKKILHQYFEIQAKKTPKFIAVAFENKTITYKELNHTSNMLGHYLRNRGIKPNDLIGIFLERGLEMVISILGVLKAGGAYLPLDPNYPNNRITYMLSNSKAPILLVSNEFSKTHFKKYSGEIINVNEIMTNKNLSKKNLNPISNHTNLAYVIYTSGTTGNPKGVAISHRSICNHMLWMQKKFQFQKNDIFLQKTPFSFDASIWEFFAPLFSGAKLVMAPHDAHTHPYQLTNLIKKNSITILQVVPTMLNELIHTHELPSCTSLKQVFSGGEALLPTVIKTFFKQNPSIELHNLYGPTETTVEVLTATCSKDDATSNSCRIGKPIFNTQVYVLDSKMQLLPIGIPGELYIGGDSLAVGYLHNTIATDQKFIPNPFSKNKQKKLYKTGDLVKWQSDGNIEYLDRIDNQLKIRGFRIETNEIETYLVKMKAIEQCIVIPVPHLDDSISLSAYITLEKKAQISGKEVRSFLRKYLPEYMIPSCYFIVDKFLFTPSGKIDRKILPTPIRQLNSSNDSTAPKNDIERLLKNIWISALKIKEIGTKDDFFELGGNSLIGMRIISAIKEQLSITLSIRKLFEFHTISSLAQEIEKINEPTISPEQDLIENCIVPLKSSGRKVPLFLIHPIGGSVFWYKLFEKYLDNDQPLYAIQDPGLDKQELFFDNLEAMANHYIKAIQTVQPKGPYLIGGASFGSTVAIEMAKQLQETGEQVPAIISLDGWAFYPTIQNSEQYFQDFMKEQNLRILQKYIENNISNSEFLLKLQSHREKLLIKYQLPIIQSKLVLFKAKELHEIFQYNAPFNWWEEYVKDQIEFHLVPGDHETMFYEPNIKTLAGKLSDSLNEKHLAIFELSNWTKK